MEEATKKKKKKKKKNKDKSTENTDKSIESTDDIQPSKDQSIKTTELSPKKKKKKHREEHSVDKAEPSNNDCEVHNSEARDEKHTNNKKNKNNSAVNEEVVNKEEHINSESHEENTSNIQELSALGQNIVNNKSKNLRTHSEGNTTTVQITNTTEHKIHKRILPNESTMVNSEGSKKKGRKRKSTGFTVEIVKNETPSKIGENKNNLKRELNSNSHVVPNKKKKNKPFDKKTIHFNKLKQKGFKNKQDNDKSDNPLNKLSDERLKAYGLNPKKYRSFLKYKKF